MSFGKIGIVNSGNNCYLNSALQFISQAVWANKDLLDEEDENDLQNIYIIGLFGQKCTIEDL